MKVLDSLVSQGGKKINWTMPFSRPVFLTRLFKKARKKQCFYALEEMKENIPELL